MMKMNQRNVLFGTLAFVAAGIMSPVQAQNQWDGGIGGDWGTPGNWSDGVPDGGDFARFWGDEGAVVGSGENATMVVITPNVTGTATSLVPNRAASAGGMPKR